MRNENSLDIKKKKFNEFTKASFAADRRVPIGNLFLYSNRYFKLYKGIVYFKMLYTYDTVVKKVLKDGQNTIKVFLSLGLIWTKT